jgi:hypothetical protein
MTTKSTRTLIALRDLHPNPFKQFVLGGRLDDTKIQRLEASVRQTDFWDNLLGREKDGHVEIAYGHKRVEAAKRVLGLDYETSIKLALLTDAQMLQVMASENSTREEESVEARIDVVTMAQKFLTENPPAPEEGFCPCGSRGPDHEPGSKRCLAGFLGWDRHKIRDLLTLRDKLSSTIRPHIIERVGSTAEGRDDGASLGRRTGTILASLAKHLQEVVYKVVRRSPSRVTDDDMTRIVRTVKATPKSRRELVAKEEARAVVREIKLRRGDVELESEP